MGQWSSDGNDYDWESIDYSGLDQNDYTSPGIEGGYNDNDWDSINQSSNNGQGWGYGNDITNTNSPWTDWTTNNFGNSLFDNPNTNVQNTSGLTDTGFQRTDDWGPGATSAPPLTQGDLGGSGGFDFSKFLSSLGNGGKNVLSTIFGPNQNTGNQTGGGGSGGSNYNDIFKTLLSLYAARDEKKSSADFENTVMEQLKGENARLDPFAGERRQYMDLLSNAGNRLENLYTNPNSSSMYTTARSEMERRIPRQMSKNRFGMGVNRAMSQGAADLQGKALADARDTFKGYMQPAGAMINPGQNTALIAALLKAKQDTAGSGNQPYFDALGKLTKGNEQTSTGNATLDEIRKLIGRG